MASNIQTKLRGSPAIQKMPKSEREWSHFVNELTNILSVIFNQLPAYVPSNGTTDRTWDADAAAGSITNPPSQAEVENIRDAVLELSDVVSTLAADLQAKDVLG